VDRLRWIGRRLVDLGRGIVDTFLRDNRVLPPVLALLALFVFAWVLAGVFLGGTDDQKPVAHRSEIAQADGAGGSDPAAPEVDNPNVDSYAAYRSKDPFRQIVAEGTTTLEGTVATTSEGTVSAPAEQTTGTGGANGGRRGGRRGADSDGDGLPDRKEAAFGQNPSNPDTDGDGIPDGLDDSDGDGISDGVEGNAAAGGGNNRAGEVGGGRGAGDRPGRGGGGRGGGLLDSGGILSPP
jgi:Bacterial TSP3 repeat